MKNLITIICLLLSTSLAFAAEVKIEPVYGFERTLRPEPKPASYRTEAILGVRATYGTKHIAAEAEVNQSNSDNTVDDVKREYNTQSALLGLRLIPVNTGTYNLYFRTGARAKKLTIKTTTAGETETNEGPIQVDPYAGAGLGLDLAGLFTLSAGATLIYNRNAEASEQYDTRYTLSAGLKFGNK